MIVYRIEHADTGEGPYVGSLSDSFWDWRYINGLTHGDSYHPTPSDDGIAFSRRSNQICGFASVESLKSWFAKCFDWLDSNGFIIEILDVDDDHVQVGRHQVVFERQFADVIRIRSIPEVIAA